MNPKKWTLSLICVSLVALSSTQAFAHCQIPSRIFDDEARFAALAEHVTTIEKSIKQIKELSAAEKQNLNQIVRWVNNKEEHANQFTEIVTYYFLAQRIKPVDPSDKKAVAKYQGQLKLLHEMIVHAMKCKQSTDLEHCAKLRSLIEAFEASYFGPRKHSHDGHSHTH